MGNAVGVQACQLAPLHQSVRGAVWLSEGGQSRRRVAEIAQVLDRKLGGGPLVAEAWLQSADRPPWGFEHRSWPWALKCEGPG